MKSDWGEAGDLLTEEIFEFGILLLRRRRTEVGELVEEYRLTTDSPNYQALESLRGMYSDEILRLEPIPPELQSPLQE